MIHSYLADDLVRIHLTGDEDSPTIFWVRPITGRANSKWQALQAHAAKKIIDAMVDQTAERALKISDAQVNEQLTFLTDRVKKIENAFHRGAVVETIEDANEIRAFLDGLLAAQRDDLLATMMNDTKLQELSFQKSQKE